MAGNARQPLREGVAQGVQWTAVAAFFLGLCNISLYLILARYLNAKDVGVFALVTLFANAMRLLSDSGLHAAVIHQKQLSSARFWCCYAVSVGANGMLIIVLWLLASCLGSLFDEARIPEFLAVLIPALFIQSLGQPMLSVLQRRLRFKRAALADVFSAVLGLGSTAYLLLEEATVLAPIIGLSVQIASRALLLGAAAITQIPNSKEDTSGVATMLRFGAFQLGERLIGLLSQRIDQLSIGTLVSIEALGFYSLAQALVLAPISRINPVITSVALAAFAKLQDDDSALKEGYHLLLRCLGLFNAMVLFCVAILAAPLVSLFLGEMWLPMVPMLQWLSLYGVLLSQANPVGVLLLAKGQAKRSFLWNMVLCAIQTPLVLLVSASSGVEGVVRLLVVLQLLYAVAAYHWLIRPLVDIRVSEYLASYIAPLGPSLFMGLIAAITIFVGVGSGLGSLLITASIMCAGFMLAIMILERELFSRIFVGAMVKRGRDD